MFKTAVNGRMALEFVSPPETKSLRFLVCSLINLYLFHLSELVVSLQTK